jgi:hypothetical protein
MTGVKKLLAKEKGSATAVASKLSEPTRACSRQLVEYWLKQGYVTPTWAVRAHSVYEVPLHELNPAVYPKSVAA